jgi:2-polyprenyl-6-methoxyphenol hydroxylase-like FAD-dependent oxidoreductase
VPTVNEPARATPVVAQADVLVVGAGPGGLAAAIAAARNGASVLLAEDAGFVGGNLAQPGLQILASHMADGRAVIGGFAQELVDRLVALGGAIPRDPCPKLGSLVAYDHQLLKCVALEMLREAGVRLMLETRAVGTVARDGRVEAVLVENTSGRGAMVAPVVVDATGDADIVMRAGGACVKGSEEGTLQPGSMLFRLGGVRLGELVDHLAKHPREVFPIGHPPVGTFPIEYFRRPGNWALTGLGETAERARAQGDFPPDLTYVNLFPMPRRDQIGVNAAKVFGLDATQADDVTRADVEGHLKVLQMLRFFRRHVPGFSDCVLLDVGVRVGVRESRRIVGRYTLTAADVLEGRRFGDVIALGCNAIDVHQPEGRRSKFVILRGPYDIPYRCLLPAGLENVLVAGRPISCDRDAFGSVRVMTHCLALGQAAGTAAALAAARRQALHEVDVTLLQSTLAAQGQILAGR